MLCARAVVNHSRHAARTYDLGNLIKRGGRCMHAAYEGRAQACASCTHSHPGACISSILPCSLKNLYDLWGLSLLTAVNPWLQRPSLTLCTTGNPALDATRVIVML